MIEVEGGLSLDLDLGTTLVVDDIDVVVVGVVGVVAEDEERWFDLGIVVDEGLERKVMIWEVAIFG